MKVDWAVVKSVCSYFNKWRDWNDEGTSSTSPITKGVTGEVPTRSDKTRRRVDTDLVAPANISSGPSGGAALEELTKIVRDLQIAHARRDGGGQSRDRRPHNGLRCMWCNGVDHIQSDYTNFNEALRNNVVYLQNDRVHASETRRPLEMNTRRGGMKRIMEEAMAWNAEAIYYSVWAGIQVRRREGHHIRK